MNLKKCGVEMEGSKMLQNKFDNEDLFESCLQLLIFELIEGGLYFCKK